MEEENQIGTVLTKKGVRLIAKILGSKTNLKITRVAVGTGSLQGGMLPEELNDLCQYKTDGMISEIKTVEEENQVNITFQVSSTGAIETYVITEAGIFAEDPDEGEILYGYLDMTEDPQLVYNSQSAISKMVEITMAVIVATTDNIIAEINPGSMVTKEELETALGKYNKVIIGTEEDLTDNNAILLEKIKDSERIFRIQEKLEDGSTLIHELAAVFEVPEVRARIQSGDAIGNLIGNIVRYLLDLKPNAFKDADNPFTLMREDTYIPPGERTKGCLYGLVTRQRGLTVINFDRYVQGDENPRQSRTLYGIETTDRTEAETSDSPYKAILRSIVHVEEGDTAQREPNKLYAVTKAQRG